jgi:hypothetical protein
MREDVLRRFFLAEVGVGRLADDVSGSVTHLNQVESTVVIEDMEVSFGLTREHVLLLCGAGLSNELNSEALTVIAFALLASDRFEWDDDVVSETLQDWSCPEINFPMNADTLRMHRSWLTAAIEPPNRPNLPSPHSGRLISVRRKVSPQIG